VELINPQNSNLSVMRTTLIPQLLQNISYNINHGAAKLRLFEQNKVFFENGTVPKIESLQLSLAWLGNNQSEHWKYKPADLDFFDIKGTIEGLVSWLGLSAYSYNTDSSDYYVKSMSQCIFVNDCIIAEYGMLQPSIAATFGIDTVETKQEIWLADINLESILELTRQHQSAYIELPRYPAVTRDVSFLITSGIAYQHISDAISTTQGVSIGEVSLIDEYKGKQVPDGFRSLTFRIVFINPEKTLTDDEVNIYLDLIVNNLKSRWEIQLR
jgi:phenylalanyl-tRNA synthetase beta chain